MEHIIIFQLVWHTAVLTATGVEQATVPAEQFKSKQECREFAEVTAPRMTDWIRGARRVPLHAPATVIAQCEPVGQPA